MRFGLGKCNDESRMEDRKELGEEDDRGCLIHVI